MALTIIAFLMIAAFLVLVIKKKTAAFTGLILTSLAAGLAACLVNGESPMTIFTWIREGLFYSVNESGKVSLGTINSTVMILFAILYFSLMMNVGLFDPLCTFLIRKAKGDPLKVMMIAVLVSSVVTLDGDGTTTILIVTAAFVPLFKQMKMKLSYLAMMIILPCSIGNCLPWGGPLARAAAVLNVEVNELFVRFLPVLAVAEVYIIVLAYFMGRTERKRLGYEPGKTEIISTEQIEQMCFSIEDNDREYKRPKLFFVNLCITVAMLTILIMGLVSGALIFMLGTAVALAINYSEKEQRDRITVNGGDAISVTSIIMAAGCFMGILNGSGMAAAIADSLAQLIPPFLGSHIALIYAFVGAVACYALPVDAYYFGILPVIVPIAASSGISGIEIGMASFMGQAIRYGSPTVAWLFLLIDKTEMSFGEYQKTFFKYAIPMFFVFMATAIAIGLFPV